jgi:acyl carrier protein
VITLNEDVFVAKAVAFLTDRIQVTELTPETELIESGLLDSLGILEFYLFLEECRGEAIPAEAASLADLGTLRRAYELLDRLPA